MTEDFWNRLLEILPGALTWVVLTSPLWLSIKLPFAAAVLVLFLNTIECIIFVSSLVSFAFDSGRDFRNNSLLTKKQVVPLGALKKFASSMNNSFEYFSCG